MLPALRPSRQLADALVTLARHAYHPDSRGRLLLSRQLLQAASQVASLVRQKENANAV